MIYRLQNGKTIDTGRDLTFEERNFIQKMMIYKHLKMDISEFRRRWRSPGSPVWQGPQTLNHPSPAAAILLDMERELSGE